MPQGWSAEEPLIIIYLRYKKNGLALQLPYITFQVAKEQGQDLK